MGMGLDSQHSVSGGAPLDLFTTPAGAYSFRKLKSNYAGNAVKIRRTTGGTQDIGFTASGNFDTAAANTFCAATNCYIDTFYDQSGNGRNVSQATTTSQPQLIFNCVGDKVCMRGTQAVGDLTGGSGLPIMTSASAVAKHEGTNNTTVLFVGPQLLAIHTNKLGFFNGSVALEVTASQAWHGVAGTINGASSSLTVDGATTTGTIAAVGGAGIYVISAGAGTTSGSVTEVIWWTGYALTQAQQQALTNNQRSFWGF